MPSKLKAWAQLLRIPNTLTACADVLAGFSIAAGNWFSFEGIWPSLVVLSLGSILLYWAGMVLNDVNDVEADRANRRLGPLVDQRISISVASKVGWSLLAGGVCCALIASLLVVPHDEWKSLGLSRSQWLVVGGSGLLAALIAAYDSRLKGTWMGPILMGACRGLNLLVGVFLGACVAWPALEEWRVVAIAVVGHVCFVTGITMAARRESSIGQSRSRLMVSWGVSVLGLVAIAMCPLFASDKYLNLDQYFVFPLLIGLLAAPWLRRAIYSIQQPGIGTLVIAIKQAILSIIYLDAALTLQFAGNIPGAIVCGLAVPTWALARYFRMT
jgi:4-hydroxybenzoate polyprenyltransferase